MKLSPKRIALIALVLVGFACATLIQNFSWNQSSHYALIRSLDERDSAVIDPFILTTGDRAYYKGHWYSSRAPGLALFSLPWYRGLVDIGMRQWAYNSPALRNDDEMIWAVGLWGNVLPGLILLLIVWRLAEVLEPGYGATTALTLGLATMILPFSTLLFSHLFTACLGMAAFWLLFRERAGPPRLWPLAVAGALIGYAIASEYPLLFVGLVIGIYALARGDTRRPVALLARAGTYTAGAIVGVLPMLFYNHMAFGSYTHIAYADLPRHQSGFFGIGTPSLSTLATLLFTSRGLLTLTPILLMGAVGLWLLWQRGRRAETSVIVAICVIFLTYNSGYFLPFGGGVPQPRFLITMVPFLALPLGLSYRRFPGPTIALAAISATSMLIATVIHPSIGYDRETVIWTRLLGQGNFQPTIASAYGAGRGWAAIMTFLVPIAAAVVLVAAVTPRMRLSGRSLAAGAAVVVVWGAFAIFGPYALGIDSAALHRIYDVSHKIAVLTSPYPVRPLTRLVPIAMVAALAALGLSRLLRNQAASGALDAASGPKSESARAGA